MNNGVYRLELVVSWIGGDCLDVMETPPDARECLIL
jgi:hypothetical protein